MGSLPGAGHQVGGGGIDRQLTHHPVVAPTGIANQFMIGNHKVDFAGEHYHPSYENHSWYHGYWNHHHADGRPGYGLGCYGQGLGDRFGSCAGYPPGWGYGGWGLGSVYYNSGYTPYANPYCSDDGGGYDYSQPIPVDVDMAPSPSDTAPIPSDAAPAASDRSTDEFNSALTNFKAGDYARALKLVDLAIVGNATDAPMREFRSLVLFALHDYSRAAATIHSVLAVGPGWDWTTMLGLYSDADTYTTQLRALEKYVELHPDKADAKFLLACHYITGGHPGQAAPLLRDVVRLVPFDRLAVALLKMTSGDGKGAPDAGGAPMADGPHPAPEDAGNQPPAQPIADAAPVDPAALLGSWRASRDDGSKFDLTLKPDKSFTWTFSVGLAP